MVRQALRPDYYTRHDPEPAYTIHISKLMLTKMPGEIPANYYLPRPQITVWIISVKR